jgi:hypothetical protein
LLLRLLIIGGRVGGGGPGGARRREISDLWSGRGLGRRRNASASPDASSQGRVMPEVAEGGSNSDGLSRPPGRSKEREASERAIEGWLEAAHTPTAYPRAGGRVGVAEEGGGGASGMRRQGWPEAVAKDENNLR